MPATRVIPPDKRYQNFDLQIEPAGNGYRARVLDSPAGQASSLIALPFNPKTEPNKVRLIGGRIRHFQASPATDEDVTPLDPKVFGTQIFSALFGGEVGVSLRRSIDLAETAGAGLRIRLRLDEAPELAALPWEYLFDSLNNRYLVLSEATPIVRYLALPLANKTLQISRPLRLLVLISDAKDVLPRLHVAEEQARLQGALQPLIDRGDLEVTWLEQATLPALQAALLANDYHIFHFIGHGWFDITSQRNGLLLENEQGKGALVETERLAVLLHNHPTLRLAFLNACEGARFAEGQPLAGVAQHLVQQGLPAVIAMQFPVSDRAAITLAQQFYSALAARYPVDAALTQARTAIYSQNSVMEWGTPVLFMRAPDGNLWQPEQEANVSKPNNAPRNINTGGNVRVGGDFVGRDKVANGDEVKGDKVMGDKIQGDKVQGHKAGGDVIVATVGAGAQNVAIGKNIQQTINQLGAPTPDDRQAIEKQFERLTALLNQSTIDPRKAGRVEGDLETLKAELTKTDANETPNANTIRRVGDWLLDNVPELAQAVTELFGLPAVAKVLGKAGDAAVAWWKGRFGN